jgi:hypothetical protein
MDCETSEEVYTATLVGDFIMGSAELDLVHYLTDDQRMEPRRDRWSGRAEDLADSLNVLDLDYSPSLVVIDSQSKSMAVSGMNEGLPEDVAEWFEKVTTPMVDRWPEAAVVSIQGRQKGWSVGMDVRQGRGSSSLLHEVDAQYMLWTKPKNAGSRTVDGKAELRCTKCRYGYRVEGSLAGVWRYGPSGFFLLDPASEDQGQNQPDSDVVKRAILELLATDPRDPDSPTLPLKTTFAVAEVAAGLGLNNREEGCWWARS